MNNKRAWSSSQENTEVLANQLELKDNEDFLTQDEAIGLLWLSDFDDEEDDPEPTPPKMMKITEPVDLTDPESVILFLRCSDNETVKTTFSNLDEDVQKKVKEILNVKQVQLENEKRLIDIERRELIERMKHLDWVLEVIRNQKMLIRKIYNAMGLEYPGEY